MSLLAGLGAGTALPPRGRVGRRVRCAIAEVEGRGTPNDSYLFFRSLSASPRFAKGPVLSAKPFAPRVRIAPARSAFFTPRPPRLVGGRVSAPDPGLARGFSPGDVGRVRPSPDPLPALQGSPAVVRGGRIRRRWSSDTRGPPNWPWPPEPGGHVPSGRRRRSRPTLTTPRESVPRRTRRGRHRTVFHACQGQFSEKPA